MLLHEVAGLTEADAAGNHRVLLRSNGMDQDRATMLAELCVTDAEQVAVALSQDTAESQIIAQSAAERLHARAEELVAELALQPDGPVPVDGDGDELDPPLGDDPVPPEPQPLPPQEPTQ